MEEKEQIIKISYGGIQIEKRETPGACVYTLRRKNYVPFIMDQDGWLSLQACMYDVLAAEKSSVKKKKVG